MQFCISFISSVNSVSKFCDCALKYFSYLFILLLRFRQSFTPMFASRTDVWARRSLRSTWRSYGWGRKFSRGMIFLFRGAHGFEWDSECVWKERDERNLQSPLAGCAFRQPMGKDVRTPVLFREVPQMRFTWRLPIFVSFQLLSKVQRERRWSRGRQESLPRNSKILQAFSSESFRTCVRDRNGNLCIFRCSVFVLLLLLLLFLSGEQTRSLRGPRADCVSFLPRTEPTRRFARRREEVAAFSRARVIEPRASHLRFPLPPLPLPKYYNFIF